MRSDLWIIEKRHADGALDFSRPQPEDYFGERAITGMTEDQLAQAVWKYTDATLDGMELGRWSSNVDPAFRERRKTW